MQANVIAISRALGANGEVIGREIAATLGYRYVDSEIIDLAAERVGATPDEVATAERRKGLLARMMDNLARANLAPLDIPADPTMFIQTLGPDYPEVIVEVIREIAAQGKCVLVAHGASHALGAEAGVLRVLITGSPDVRARRVHQEAHGFARSRQQIDESDKARADFLKRFYGIDAESPGQYDLVLNTDRLSVADAVKSVLSVAG